nr:hypothetical protein [uncultured Flavobacterium sp.]
MNTLDAYKKAIKEKYEGVKSGDFSDYLINPSPAKIKKLCALLFEINMDFVDKGIFDRFFNFEEKENKIKQIEKFDTDKFRPFVNFLIKNTDITQIESLNLIAVLVDFSPRPYVKFRNGDYDDSNEIVKISGDKRKLNSTDFTQGLESVKRFSLRGKVIIGFLVLLVFTSLGYSLKSICFPDKNGMIWVENHYEVVGYDEVKNKEDVKPINQFEVDHFRKISVCDTTTFFKNGLHDLPMVWYAKEPITGKYEYFSQPGLHPITGKTLKKISPYIIKKYIANK